MMITSSHLLSGMIAGETIATNFAILFQLIIVRRTMTSHLDTGLRIIFPERVSSFECSDHCDETVGRGHLN